MARIGSLPSVPEEFRGDVVSTSWSLANTNRDPKLVVRAEPAELATQCPSCHNRLLINVVGTNEAARQQKALDARVGSAMRHATQIADDAPLSTAAELLTASSRRVIVVVDPRHRPVGVLTSTQVLAAVKSYPRDQLSTVSALQVATSSGPLLPAHLRLDAALRVLAREDREFVLVVDSAGVLMGVLLPTDVLNAQASAARDPY